MLEVYHLTCQRVKTPLGIAGIPTFSWRLRSKERNQRQCAYRIQAASAPEKLPAPDLYDSGQVFSDETLDIPWNAAPLKSFQRVYWTVTVWDQDMKSSSGPETWFESGVNPEDFLDKTIFAGDAPDPLITKTAFATTAPALDGPALPPIDGDGPPPEMPGFAPTPTPEFYFHKAFSIFEPIARARLYLAASGPCLVYLNGASAGEWLHDPSPNMCSYRSLYTIYDITSGLTQGENVIGISSSGRNITPLIFLEAEDGRVIPADSTWRWRYGPTTLIGTGEQYDARTELRGWAEPGFDDAGWNDCGIGPDPLVDMYPNQMAVQRVVWHEHPIHIEKTPWGTWRCRASRITAGRVRFQLSAPAGTEIRLYLAEKELKNGEIIRGTDPLGNPEEGGHDCFTYIFAGNGPEEWAPRYSYSGIGWLEIAGYPGEISAENIWFEAVLNDTPVLSTMESSVPMFDQLHEALIRTIQNNFHGVLTTCPPYEKGPADGDTSVTLPAFLWNLDCLPIIKRLDDDFAATIRCRQHYTEEDLRENRVAPGMIRTVPEWSSMLVHNCWNLWSLSGVRDEAARFYPELQRYWDNELAELHFSDYLVDSFFGGDWNSPEGNGAPEGGTLSGTCYEYFSLRTMQNLCNLVGRIDDGGLYRLEAEQVRRSIHEKCFHGDTYETAKTAYFPQWGPPPYGGDGQEPLPVGYRQTSNLLPLAFGITPIGDRPAVLQRLVQEIHKKDDHLDTGFVGAKYLLNTLTDFGHLELAYTIATKRDYPSWGYWLEHGATTCWEHWGTFARSYDHFFLAAGLEDWFRESLGGIREVQNGFRQFKIAPKIPEEMTHFSISSETARGRVVSAWQKTEHGIRFQMEVPVGCTAEVELPAAPTQTLWQNGKKVPVGTIVVCSGQYTFELTNGTDKRN